MTLDQSEMATLERARDVLVQQVRTLIIAAPQSAEVEEEGGLGVTPTVHHDGCFHIYPSALSSHVRAMLQASRAQFLAIEDEESAQNIWARKRIKFEANIVEIDKKTYDFNSLSELFLHRHGPTMNLIRDFADFHMIRLVPVTGVMVLGFAKAYRLQGPELAITDHLRSS